MEKVIQNKTRFTALIFAKLLKRAFTKLLHNDPLRMAGATAFFTSFALPFILLILTQVLGFFYDATKVRSQMFQSLANMLGRNTMQQVVVTLRAFRQLADNWIITVIGVLFLFLVSTTLLMVIKTSINQLWRIRIVQGQSFLSRMRSRVQSVLIIIGTGILFFLSILAEGLKAYLDKSINAFSPAVAHYFIGFANYLSSVVFVTFWFALILRLLPDARVPWKIAFTGGFVTSILFNVGKIVLRVLLVNSNLSSLYGASASIVLLLLFVFYSSLIMYYGVAFTRIWAEHVQALIKPLPYATRYKLAAVNEET